MASLKTGKTKLKQLSQGSALCGVPIVGGASTDLLGIPMPHEILSLALASAAFAGAGVWMFRRWGKKSPATHAPEPSSDPQQERGLTTN